MQHGEGIFILPNGKERKGMWENGQRINWIDEPYLNPDNVNSQSLDSKKNKKSAQRQADNNIEHDQSK